MRHAFLNLIGCVLFLSVTANAAPDSADPYSQIERITEPNGLEVFLSPQDAAKTFQIRIEVKAGFASETRAIAGVSHMIEHYLFTDAKLKDDMSYLEVIREKGGDGNAETSKMRTVYYATVPPKHAEWLATLFAKMIFERRFEQTRVEEVRKPVIIEIGRPSFTDYLGQVGLIKLLDLDIFRTPDFWESEFGIYHKTPYRPDDRFNATKLSAARLQKYYDQYYWPGNITLFIAGKFDPRTVRPLVAQLFGSAPARRGETLDDWPVIKSTESFIRSESTTDTPRIGYGVKVWDLAQKDELTLRVYLEYVAHRLMKEIRNKRGDTYTASATVGLIRNDGFAGINMDARTEDYYRVLDYLKTLLRTETQEGKFSEKQFREAIGLYSSTFKLNEHDSGTSLRLAQDMYGAERAYGKAVSPYLVYKTLDYSEFKATLSRLFQTGRTYSWLVEPPVLFRYEYAMLMFLLIVSLWLAADRALSKPFKHAHVRLVRKLVYPPAYFLQITATFLSAIVGIFLARAVYCACFRVPFVLRSFLFSEYFLDSLELFLVFASVICALSLVKRKIIVCDNALYIKSLTYISERIPLSNIVKLELVSPWKPFLSIQWLTRIKYRIFRYDLLPWRPAVCMTLKDGRSYMFGFDDPKAVKSELETLLKDEAGNWGQRSAA